jgi:transposase
METIKQVVGVDVSKDTFHVCLGTIDTRQKVKTLRQSSFSNTTNGFKEFLVWKNKHWLKGIPLWYVMEATGVYYENLAYFIVDHKENVAVLLPNKAKHYAKSLDIKTKTDKIDAAMLCRIGLERLLPTWKLPSTQMKIIKSISREYRSLKNEGTRIKAKLHACKYSYKPEPTTIRRLKTQLALIENQLKEVLKELKLCVKQDANLCQKVKDIEQVKGLGFITIITVLAETNGFASVENNKQLASYCGLDVVMNQSGKHYGRTRISKKGNSHIRQALYLPAMSAMRSNTRMKQYYENIMLTHTSGKIGIVAVARKLLILIYTLWKTDKGYDPNRNVKIIN